MSVALARRQDAGMTDEQIDLIRRTIAKDATEDELQMFISTCNRLQLDPFARQIFFVKYGGQAQTVVSIDGYRITAERTGKYEGQDGPYWCGGDGIWRDVWLDKNPPAAAKVGAWKAGARQQTWGVARFSSYTTGHNLWKKMPETMIAKCAEAIALRKAFPAELSGVYTVEEMEQARKAGDPDPPYIEADSSEDEPRDEPRDYPGLIAAAKCEQDLLDLLPELRKLPRDEFREQLNREFNDRMKELRGAAR